MENIAPLSPAPTIDLSPTNVLITVGKQTPDPDRTLRVKHAENYPLQVWYFLASFIFLLSVINHGGRLMGYYFARVQRRQLRQASKGFSAQDRPTRGSVNLLRLPQALTETGRALCFRWTITIGRSYTLNLADVFLSAAYFVICVTWSLINCKLQVCHRTERNL